MKFVVSVEDFWLEEEGFDLSTALKDAIRNDVIAQIRQQIKKQVDDFMNSYIIAEISKNLEKTVQSLMDNVINTGKVKGRYSTDPDMTVDEWVRKEFANKRTDVEKAIEKKVLMHVKDLQGRYDLLFATQLISKIKDAGFLKEDVEKLIEVVNNNKLTVS